MVPFHLPRLGTNFHSNDLPLVWEAEARARFRLAELGAERLLASKAYLDDIFVVCVAIVFVYGDVGNLDDRGLRPLPTLAKHLTLPSRVGLGSLMHGTHPAQRRGERAGR